MAVTAPPVVLVVEQDPLMLTAMAAILDQQGHRCFLARDPSVARKAISTLQVDLVLFSCEGTLEETIQTVHELRQVKEQASDIPFLFLTPQVDRNWLEKLQSIGGSYCLQKPFDPNVLIDLVDRALWMPHLVHSRVAPPKAHFSSDWVRLS